VCVCVRSRAPGHSPLQQLVLRREAGRLHGAADVFTGLARTTASTLAAVGGDQDALTGLSPGPMGLGPMPGLSAVSGVFSGE